MKMNTAGYKNWNHCFYGIIRALHKLTNSIFNFHNPDLFWWLKKNTKTKKITKTAFRFAAIEKAQEKWQRLKNTYLIKIYKKNIHI